MTALRAVRPPTLYVIGDGPRVEAEREVCLAARAEISAIDWQCDIRTRYSDVNLGLNASVLQGVTWVLAGSSHAIFLEDDCIPDTSFFRFCDELLVRYADDPRVTQICGHNRLRRWKHREQSYHFGVYGSSWGWATWRRAWDLLDDGSFEVHDPMALERIASLLADAGEFRYFQSHPERARSAGTDLAWDYRWAFAQLSHGGLTLTPSVDLVANIGFGRSATHTRRRPIGLLPEAESVDFPLRHPANPGPDRDYDHRFFRWAIGDPDAASVADLGLLLLERGRCLEALLVVDRLYRRDPACVDTAIVRARALVSLDRFAAARDSLLAARAASPGDARLLRAWAETGGGR